MAWSSSISGSDGEKQLRKRELALSAEYVRAREVASVRLSYQCGGMREGIILHSWHVANDTGTTYRRRKAASYVAIRKRDGWLLVIVE